MTVETKKYLKKPLYVDAVLVTSENFEDVASWCQGEIKSEEVSENLTNKYIKVRVNNPMNQRQTKAFVGDWILYNDRGGYKVYTEKAFEGTFVPVDNGAVGHSGSVGATVEAAA